MQTQPHRATTQYKHTTACGLKLTVGGGVSEESRKYARVWPGNQCLRARVTESVPVLAKLAPTISDP